jgi:CRP-like cAMP-binding protein
MLLHDASYIEMRAGQMLAHVGDILSTTFFPDDGLLTLTSEMATGHHIAVAAVGAESVIGLGVLCGMRQHPCTSVALVESRGYRVPARLFVHAFETCQHLRRLALERIGIQVQELVIAAACNRMHSHRQRLSRWLLVATDKAGQCWLPVTHDALAQLVGGPRHAVTIALNELRENRAIAYQRGRVDVLDRSSLVRAACECYRWPIMSPPR